MNYIKTFILLGLLTAVFILIGYSLGGKNGMMIALIFAFVMNFVSYWYSDSIVLKMYNAKLIDPNEFHNYYKMVETLCNNANLPMTKLYIMENDIPNAFATGRNPQNSAVCISRGIYNLLSTEELSGVVAHELAHIKNYDTLTSAIVASISSAISMIANIFMFTSLFGGNRGREGGNPISAIAIMIVAPLVATIIQMTISRQREYEADKCGGEICKNPLYLASALEKLESSHSKNPQPLTQATAHLFIINPLSSNTTSDNLFSTHPKTQNRVYQLTLQAQQMNINLANNNFNKQEAPKRSKKIVNDDPNNIWN